MFLKLQAMKTVVLVNTDHIAWLEPTPAGTSTNLILQGGVALTINEHFDDVSEKLNREHANTLPPLQQVS